MVYQNIVGHPVLFGIAGEKNSGKTTLMESLIRILTGRGFQVAAIKHDGHDFEADREALSGRCLCIRSFFFRKISACEKSKKYETGRTDHIFS